LDSYPSHRVSKVCKIVQDYKQLKSQLGSPVFPRTFLRISSRLIILFLFLQVPTSISSHLSTPRALRHQPSLLHIILSWTTSNHCSLHSTLRWLKTTSLTTLLQTTPLPSPEEKVVAPPPEKLLLSKTVVSTSSPMGNCRNYSHYIQSLVGMSLQTVYEKVYPFLLALVIGRYSLFPYNLMVNLWCFIIFSQFFS
jgi:hypothetical protein